MTSSMTSQGDLKIVSLYFFMNEYEWKNNSFRDNQRTNKGITFRLGVHMYHRIVNTPLHTVMDCFIDDVIGSQNVSKLWTAIALSIFQLEHRSKAQNLTNYPGYHSSIFDFRYPHGKICVAISKRRPVWKCQNIKHSFNFTSEIKRSSQIMQGKIFSWWWRHRWRLRKTSNRLSVFLYKHNIFRHK